MQKWVGFTKISSQNTLTAAMTFLLKQVIQTVLIFLKKRYIIKQIREAYISNCKYKKAADRSDYEYPDESLLESEDDFKSPTEFSQDEFCLSEIEEDINLFRF